MGRSAKITRTAGFMKQKKIAKGKDWRASGAKAIRDEKKAGKREVHHPDLIDAEIPEPAQPKNAKKHKKK